MVAGIIVAAGSGFRMGAGLKKQYMVMGGLPILARTMLAFDKCPAIDRVFLVTGQKDHDFCRENILKPQKFSKEIILVSGGALRQESVANGIAAASPKTRIIVIHDGVRPFVDMESITACVKGAKEHGACILGVPASDTLKQTNGKGRIIETLDRRTIWLAQTPQAFEYELIRDAHQKAAKEGFIGTDDACLVERMGKPVHILCGSPYNIKITTPQDLPLAEAILAAR